MERPVYEKIVFTADTVIPDLPTGKDKLKEPSKAELDRELGKLDSEISNLRSKKDQMIK